MNPTMPNQITSALRNVLLLAGLVLWPMQPQLAFAAGGNSGQQLYLAHCAGCHGINGISVMPQAKNFSRMELARREDQSLIDIIRSGREMMPAYFGILNDGEILNVINYLRTLN